MNMETTAAAPGASSHMPMSTKHMHMNMKPMWMWFHTTVNDVVLFESWTVTTPGGMVWTCFVVMAMGILLEFVRYVRWRLELRNRTEVLLSTKYATFTIDKSQSYVSRLFSTTHFLQTACFGVQLVLGYLLMLIFMTFSVWLGLAVCIGAGEAHCKKNLSHRLSALRLAARAAIGIT
ncbi:Ctr copper transporter family protein [Ancylostoma caninum]|uniref:Copper transport protein n=1 Tax=Ancylostoma caninum TaxID=29170 RepID=A0A368GSF2_ANCCA|nr:Ctr copper transporter family protein [Ancylostoma caninum]